MMLHQNFSKIKLRSCFNFIGANFPKSEIPNSARIHSPDPFLRAGNSVSVLPNPNPQKNSFGKTESALVPPHCPNTWRAEPQKEKCPFLFRRNWSRANPKSKEHFFFLGLPSEARRWRGFRRAYDLVSSHHALRAWHISDFGNRCELGTIETPKQNLTIFSVDTNGRRKAPTKDFLAGLQENSEFLARKRAVFFRRGGGAKSKAILTNFALPEIQKEFLLL